MSATTGVGPRTGALTARDVNRTAPAPAGHRRAAGLWTAIAAGLALSASAAGLLVEQVYTGAASTAEMLRGYDLVTAVVAAAALAVGVRTAYRAPTKAPLAGASLLAYLVYTYAYHLFGTAFNDLFLLHAAIVGSGVVALVLQLTSIDVDTFAEQARTGRGVRGAAVVIGALAAALGGMWVYVGLGNTLTGDTPAGSQLVETATIVHLGMALDLALLVPLYAGAAVLLWRRTAWGYVLATIALFSGVLHQVSYMVAMPFQVAGDVPGAVSFDPGEPFIVLLYLLGIDLLLRRPEPGRGRTARPA